MGQNTPHYLGSSKYETHLHEAKPWCGAKTTFDGTDELLLILYCQRKSGEGPSWQQAKQESENEMSWLPIFVRPISAGRPFVHTLLRS
jgi:hypothetical protein